MKVRKYTKILIEKKKSIICTISRLDFSVRLFVLVTDVYNHKATACLKLS